MKRKVQVVIIEKDVNQNKLIQFKLTPERGAFWQNITGSVEEGENWEEGARRELLEETGLSVGPLIDLNHHFQFKDRWGHDVEERCFLAFLTSPRLIRLSHEHDSYRSLNLEQVRPDSFGFLSSYEAFLKAKLKAH